MANRAGFSLREVRAEIEAENWKANRLSQEFSVVQNHLLEAEEKFTHQITKLSEHREELVRLLAEVEVKIIALKERHENVAKRGTEIEKELEPVKVREEAADRELKKAFVITQMEDEIAGRSKSLVTLQQKLATQQEKLTAKNVELALKDNEVNKAFVAEEIQEKYISEAEQEQLRALEAIESKEKAIQQKELEIARKEALITVKLAAAKEVAIMEEELEQTSAEWRKHNAKCSKSLAEEYKKLKSKEEQLGKLEN